MPSPLQQLAVGRIVIGVLSWIAPGFVGKVLGLGTHTDAHYTSRLFGARDIALGVGTLTSQGETKRTLVQLGVLCDALDVGAALVGKQQKSLTSTAGLLMTGIAAGAAVTGVATLVAGDDS